MALLMKMETLKVKVLSNWFSMATVNRISLWVNWILYRLFLIDFDFKHAAFRFRKTFIKMISLHNLLPPYNHHTQISVADFVEIFRNFFYFKKRVKKKLTKERVKLRLKLKLKLKLIVMMKIQDRKSATMKLMLAKFHRCSLRGRQSRKHDWFGKRMIIKKTRLTLIYVWVKLILNPVS